MRPINTLRTIAALALLSAPVALQAQGRAAARPAAHDRDGYSVSLGLGGGSSGVTCNGCVTTRENGASGYLRVGKGMTPSLMMGLEMNGWSKTENNVVGTSSMLNVIGQYYPSLTNGFFVKSGVGMGITSIEDKTVTPADKLKSSGFGYQLGMGYDMSIARRWSITPYVNYLATAGAKAQLNGVNTNEKFDSNYFQYGLGLSWH